MCCNRHIGVEYGAQFATKRRLPDYAQYSVPDVMTVPDFFYAPNVCIYCDGSVHDESQQRTSNEVIRRELKARGYRVIVPHYDGDLETALSQHADVFGCQEQMPLRRPCPARWCNIASASGSYCPPTIPT